MLNAQSFASGRIVYPFFEVIPVPVGSCAKTPAITNVNAADKIVFLIVVRLFSKVSF